MTFKPTIWFPIAVGLSVINLVGVGFAAGQVEPWHAAIHAGLALAFGLWAQRLRSRLGGSERQARPEALEAQVSGLEALEALEVEVSRLRQEVSDMQERLDFAERLLAQRPDPRRVGPERQDPKQP